MICWIEAVGLLIGGTLAYLLIILLVVKLLMWLGEHDWFHNIGRLLAVCLVLAAIGFAVVSIHDQLCPKQHMDQSK